MNEQIKLLNRKLNNIEFKDTSMIIKLEKYLQLTNISLRCVSEFNPAESNSCRVQLDPRIDWSAEVDG